MEEKEEHWRATLRVMNERFKSRLDENVFEGVREEIIHHGLRHSITTTVHKTFTDLCFCNETQEYLLLDRGVEVQRYSMQGKQLQPSFALHEKLNFTRMLWCGGEAECLACYDPDQSHVWLLTPKFVILRIVGLDFSIGALHYVEALNEIVIVGAQQVVRYVLENLEESKTDQEDLRVPKPLNYSDPEFGPTWQLECSALILNQQSACPYVFTK
ncbi:hypothetical protein QAD02_017112 [Eretmocerus hayati]|uniref:Uncharacterized protein n=1 Tax=Eretmocerus hayati TaxID=131215 RepID=A0ACC2PCH8_9HYME|nr:hypothetical protein QAD02_017112 [Eretmocerus hayati]